MMKILLKNFWVWLCLICEVLDVASLLQQIVELLVM